MSSTSLLIHDVRPVGLDGPAGRAASLSRGEPVEPVEPVDVLVIDGVIREVGPRLTGRAGRGVDVLDAGGRFGIPGLWDQHVHLDQWALQQVRLDTTLATGPGDVVELVRRRVAELGTADRTSVVQGWGHRSSTWAGARTAAALDDVSGEHPVVLISGDAHHGWMNSVALQRLGFPTGAGAGVVEEGPWFAAYGRLGATFGPDPHLDDGLRTVLRSAAELGVVGVVDFEFGGALGSWPGRVAAGLDTLRVRASTYEDGLADVLARGLRTGDSLDATGLVTMGQLKLISDGSLNTCTAHCCSPYLDGTGRGAQNYSAEQLVELLGQAARAGLECAVHAIGDAAVEIALDAFAATRAHGSIEHAQLVRWPDVPRLAALGLRASVQPAHLLDDRDVSDGCWADRTERCFVLRSMLDAGIGLALGSDAPVSPLDPWLAMAAAVHRSGDDRAPWHPEQAISVREALAASVDGQRLVPGSRGDVVLLDTDPLALQGDLREVAHGLRRMRAGATIVAGRLVHGL